MLQVYSSTQVSGKIVAETGGFQRRFKPPFSQDAKPSHPASTALGKPNPPTLLRAGMGELGRFFLRSKK